MPYERIYMNKKEGETRFLTTRFYSPSRRNLGRTRVLFIVTNIGRPFNIIQDVYLKLFKTEMRKTMNKINLMGISVITVIALSLAQINLLSNQITFRTGTDQSQSTTHHGNMAVYGYNTTTYDVLYTTNTYSGALDRVAIHAVSTPQANYGYGGRFEGGYTGITGSATMVGNGARYGGFFSASGGNLTSYGNYAVCANAPQATNSWAGWFQGNVYVSGIFSNPSDEKFKKETKPLNGSLGKIMQLNPVSYYFDTTAWPKMSFPTVKQNGLMAQEVEIIFPELVTESTIPDTAKTKSDAYKQTFKGVNYIGLIAILVNAVQEQQKEIEELQAKIK
jgi:hypothetical protein